MLFSPLTWALVLDLHRGEAGRCDQTTGETQLNPTTASGDRNGAESVWKERRATHTGLEFREQWSTIISGRKSSLKEAIFTKLSLFSVRITSSTGQGDQGAAGNSRLETSTVPEEERTTRTVRCKKLTHMETPSTGAQNTADEVWRRNEVLLQRREEHE